MNKPLAMIVEDDPFLGEIYAKTLEKDFEIELIAHGADALQRLMNSSQLPSLALVILDINLPGYSGNQLFDAIRADPGLDSVRVIVCSASRWMVEQLGKRADLALVKPISPHQLRSHASRLMASGAP
jgi:CheY-like chemotaxis protein